MISNIFELMAFLGILCLIIALFAAMAWGITHLLVWIDKKLWKWEREKKLRNLMRATPKPAKRW